MDRVLYLGYRGAAAGIAWFRRRFTRAGWAVLAGLAMAAISGFDTEKSLIHEVFALLLALSVTGLAGAAWFRGRFQVERHLPRYGSVGVPFQYRVRVRNGSDRRQEGLHLREDPGDTRIGWVEFAARMKAPSRRRGSFRIRRGPARVPRTAAHFRTSVLPTLGPRGEAEATMELVPRRRGVIRLEGMTVARPDPLGLCLAVSRSRQPDRVLVLPKRYPLPPLALPGTSQYQQGGVALAASVGQSDEFVALRDYRPGDPLRHVHWRTWARVGRPVVKEFEDEFFVRHALILDTFAAEPDGLAFEEAVSVAASFACTVRTQESLLDLLFVGAEAYCFTAGRGVGHTEQLLEVLAGVSVCAEHSVATLTHRVLEHARLVSGCVVILLEWDAAREELVRRLTGLGVPTWVLVVVESDRAQELRTRPGLPERTWLLEVGRIEEGLARLG